MKIRAVHTQIFEEKADLAAFVVRFIPSVAENTVLAVSSKVVALWKGNTLAYQSLAQKEKLIKQYSQGALKTPLAWLTIKDGMIMTNAGIDESNANGKLILLPDCYDCAHELRIALQKMWKVHNLGIVVTDSMILPLRAADSLATAAALVMGEAAEQCPLCIIEGAPVVFRDIMDRDEIKYPVKNDLYTPLLRAAKLIEEEK